ncbi:hypothetical protein, partial [Enterococcus innesii]|uniref:hypothetical protein n=1 Tax=Enterococcus innesii TaxID=2839759 RepID=UPI003F84C5C5
FNCCPYRTIDPWIVGMDEKKHTSHTGKTQQICLTRFISPNVFMEGSFLHYKFCKRSCLV